MKRERRVELRENELAQSLQDLWASLRKHAPYIAAAAVAVAVILAVINYVSEQRHAAVQEKRAEIMRIVTEYQQDRQADKAIDALKKVSSDAKQPEVAKEALRLRGRLAEDQALKDTGGPDVSMLDNAREAYTQLLERFGNDSMLEAGSALSMLASLEADYFAADGNPARKETARKYWERLRDESRFKGTPYQSEALVKLNEIDRIFKTVKMVDAPPPPPPTATQPSTQPAAATMPTVPVPIPEEGFTPLEPAPPDSESMPSGTPPEPMSTSQPDGTQP
jgi:hypothetical protein